ncbi:MAG: amino acid ABC transporter permease, partial [Geobacter sp.]|nr:amino acid ABC transporter permease [Geobacter sp.]
MDGFLNFQVISDNFTYFMIGRFPTGPLGGLGLTIYLAVVSCILSFVGGLVLGLLSISRHRWIALPTSLFI